MTFIKNLFIGIIIGISNIIPGVSGGTMMVVFNVFDKLVHAVSKFTSDVKNNFLLLFSIVSGAGLGILLFSKGLSYLLSNFYMVTNFFFIGIILGSFPMVYKKSVADKFKPLHLIPCAITLAIMLFTVYFVPNINSTVKETLSVFTFFHLLIISALAAFCMIIPGISGSFVMVLFGTYETVIAAISKFNILILIPVAIGCLIGLFLGSKIIDKLLRKYPQATYFSILGFMIGSIPAIIQNVALKDAFIGGTAIIYSALFCILGLAISLIFSVDSLKNRIFMHKN
ncbi:MAG: DUF368 domain-containing protein [Oscillospiraceae bacterium]